MPIVTGQIPFKGMSGGYNSEKSVVNVVPTELEIESRNMEILRDGTLRPRRGGDFVGISETGNYMHEIRTGLAIDEVVQESPNAIFAPFKTSSGESLDFDIHFQNMSFKAYLHTLIQNFDDPDQTLTPTPTDDIVADQVNYTVSMKFANNRLFFVGKFIKPGYIYLDDDDETLVIRYYSMHIRDYANATTASSRVTLNGKYYECVIAHTSDDTDLTDVDAYGELVFNKYWVELNASDAPDDAVAWADDTSYVTNVTQVVDKHTAASGNNPFTVDYYDERLWVALEDNVYFSQIIIDVDDEKSTPTGTVEFGLFMTYADPFDANDPDPVASDGGVIPITSGRIRQILSIEDSMFIGTTRAVQEIRGLNERFSATNFKKTDSINEGINGIQNMVVADNRMYVFATSNIWTGVQQQRSIQGSVTIFAKVGNTKIKNYYQGITKENKGTSYCVYSPIREKIYFFHNYGVSPFDTTHRTVLGQLGFAKNILVVDTTEQGIEGETQEQQSLRTHVEIWEFADTAHRGDVYIAAAYITNPVNAARPGVVVGLQNQVVVGGDRVVSSSTGDIQISGDDIVLILMQRTKDVANVVISSSVGVLNSNSLRDWDLSSDYRKDYYATAHLGTQLFENLIDNKAVPYAGFIFEKLPDGVGSCKFRSSFNFAQPTDLGQSTGKTSGFTEVYQDTKIIAHGSIDMTNYKATWYKHRIKGRGKGFQPTLTNTPGQDFKLLGWGELASIKRR